MDELRHSHLGSDTPPRSPSVRERLNGAYLAATNPRNCQAADHSQGRQRIPPEMMSHMGGVHGTLVESVPDARVALAWHFVGPDGTWPLDARPTKLINTLEA
jgi:hypothetical protein